MPRVPYYDNYGVTPVLQDPMTNAQATPQAFGSDVGAAMEGFGNQIKASATEINQALDIQKKRDDETKVTDDFTSKISPAFRELSNDYRMKTRGRATLDQYEEYKTKASQLRDSLLMEDSDPERKAALTKLINARFETTMGGFDEYFLNQRDTVETQSHEGMMSVLEQDVYDNPHDEGLFQNRLASGYSEIERRSDFLNLDANSREAEMRKWQLKLFSTVGTLKMQQDPIGAKEWMDRQIGMPEGVRSTMTEKLRPLIRGANAIKTYNQIAYNQQTQTPSMQINTDGRGFGGGFTGKLKEQYDNVPPQIDALYKKYAELNGIPYQLLRSVSFQESKYNPTAKSPAGAMGLMQLMPATAAELGLRGDDVYDPEKNIAAGAVYLSKRIKEYGGNIAFGLAAYNAGSGRLKGYTKNGQKIEGAISKAKRAYGDNPTEAQIMEFMPDETKNYVNVIAGGQTTVTPPPPIFTGTPQNASHSKSSLLLKQQSVRIELYGGFIDGQYVKGQVERGVIDIETAALVYDRAEKDTAEQTKMIDQQSITASQELFTYTRNRPDITEANMLSDPYIAARWGMLTMEAQINFIATLGATEEDATKVDIVLSDPQTNKIATTLAGGRDPATLPWREQYSTAKKAVLYKDKVNATNYKDAISEARQVKINGGQDNYVEKVFSNPLFQNYSEAQQTTLLAEAANAEAEKSTNRLDHFKKVARITGNPSVPPLMDGWDKLKAPEQTSILQEARDARGQTQSDISLELQKVIVEKNLQPEDVPNEPLYKKLNPIEQEASRTFARTRNVGLDIDVLKKLKTYIDTSNPTPEELQSNPVFKSANSDTRGEAETYRRTRKTSKNADTLEVLLQKIKDNNWTETELRKDPMFKDASLSIQRQLLQNVQSSTENLNKEAWELAVRISDGRGNYKDADVGRLRYLLRKNKFRNNSTLSPESLIPSLAYYTPIFGSYMRTQEAERNRRVGTADDKTILDIETFLGNKRNDLGMFDFTKERAIDNITEN